MSVFLARLCAHIYCDCHWQYKVFYTIRRGGVHHVGATNGVEYLIWLPLI